MARKFSEDLEIRLDSHQNRIVNKDKIINAIKEIKSEEELKAVLEYYYRIFETNVIINKTELKEIVLKIKEHQTTLNKKPLVSFFKEIKEKYNNLKNITVVRTEKEDNDKINGMKRGVTYIEFTVDGKKEIYEVLNENAVEQIIKSEDIIESLSEKELMEKLKEHAIKRRVTEIDRRPNENLNSDAIMEEINNIPEAYVREAFLAEETTVLKERVDLQKYINDNMRGATINYALNTNGERIYLVEDKVFKFVGAERELRELTGNELNASGEFSRNKKGTGNIKIENKELYSIEDFIGTESYIDNIIESISMDIGVNDNQIEFLTRFLEICLEREREIILNEALSQEKDYSLIDIPGELKELYEKYCDYAKESSKYVNTRIAEVIEKREELKKMEVKDKKIEKPHELKLTPDKLTPAEKAGFISVTIILEATTIIGGILAILALVKK